MLLFFFQARFLSFGLPRNRYFKSSVWPGVKDNLNIVAANSRWIIGNGENISLWFDNWLGDTLAALLNLHPQVFPRLKATLALVIVDGKWQIPRFIYDYPQVANQIMQIMLPVSPLPDKRVWIHTSDGLLAFLFLHPSPNTLDWASTIWKTCILPSHSFVFWRLMLSKIPTDDNMQARGCTLVSVCLLCYKHAECSTHLFLECDFARNIWIWLGLKLECSIPFVSFAALLECIPQRCSSQIRDVMVAAVVHTIYSIWLARNALRFNSAKVSIHATLAKISSFISMSGTISKGHCVATDVDILNNLFITPIDIRIREIIPVVWKAPTFTWVKANTDGSVRNTMAACGGIFCDYRGTFVGGFASNIGGGSVFDLEILGLILAMEFAVSNNWTRLWLETDSTSAIQAFHKPILIPIIFRNHWHNCTHRGLMVICSHIFREGNCCADGLADMGHAVTDTSWFTTLPPLLLADFARDKNGLPNYRFP